MDDRPKKVDHGEKQDVNKNKAGPAIGSSCLQPHKKGTQPHPDPDHLSQLLLRIKDNLCDQFFTLGPLLPLT